MPERAAHQSTSRGQRFFVDYTKGKACIGNRPGRSGIRPPWAAFYLLGASVGCLPDPKGRLGLSRPTSIIFPRFDFLVPRFGFSNRQPPIFGSGGFFIVRIATRRVQTTFFAGFLTLDLSTFSHSYLSAAFCVAPATIRLIIHPSIPRSLPSVLSAISPGASLRRGFSLKCH